MKARIYQPAQNTMQSGVAKTKNWVLEFDRNAPVGPEALMGWTESGDTLNQVRIKFETLEDAKEYAQGQGLDFMVSPANSKKLKPRNYGDNFKYIPYEETK